MSRLRAQSSPASKPEISTTMRRGLAACLYIPRAWAHSLDNLNDRLSGVRQSDRRWTWLTSTEQRLFQFQPATGKKN